MIYFVSFIPIQSMKKETSIFNKAIPAALIPFVAPIASFAAEGTGRVRNYLIQEHFPIDRHYIILS